MRRESRRIVVYLIFFVIIFMAQRYAVNALNPQKAITQYKLDSWSAEQSHPLNVIFSIIQSPSGYLWLGTRDGLVRFDGIRFTVFNRNNTRELKSDIIRALCFDRTDALWIGTSEGGLTRLHEGKFTTYSLEEYPVLNGILSITQGREDELWIGTKDNGLVRFKNGNFTTYTTANGLISDQVRALLYDKKGNLWIGAANGLAELTANGEFLNHRFTPQIPDGLVYYLFEKRNGDLWISTISGLYRVKNDRIDRLAICDALPNPKIIVMYEDKDRNCWLGTDGGGLARVKENGEFETFSVADGLKCGYIFSFCEDREGSLWVGALTGGLHRFKDTMFTVYTTREGLAHDSIECIHQDSRGNIRIGAQGGLSRLKEGRLFLEFSTRQGLLDNVVYSLMEDSAGGLWIGTQAGLHCFKDGKLSRFTSKNGLADNHIISLLQDRHGAIWIGTLNGLNRLQDGKFTVFDERSGLTHHTVKAIHEDRQGNLWIATENGLNKIRSGKIITYTMKNGLADNSVECIYEDKQGVLYIGTRAGLSRFADGRFFNFTSSSGLITSRVSYILEDGSGCLWLAGPSGISRIKKSDLEAFMKRKIDILRPVTYDEQDGLETRWCKNIGLKSRDGRLWFATDKGAVSIDPAVIERNTPPPPAAIEELIVDGEKVNIDAGADTIVIPPGKKRLEFYYTAPGFLNPDKITFKVKLQGYDADWIERGNQRSAAYTGLSPRKYTFTAAACSADGVWNEKGASLTLNLQPYWYQTPLAYLFAGLFILAAATFFIKWRSWKHVKEKQRLERIIAVRTKEIKDKNIQLLEQSEKLKEMDKVKSRFFANISHEFRTPLTLIMGPLEQMLDEAAKSEQRQKLGIMLRSVRRLLSLINQLLELSRFESGKMKLQARRQDIVSFLKGVVETFDSLAAQHELKLTFRSGSDEIMLYFDSEKMENIICNLLINAVKFTPAGGEISVSLESKEEPSPGFVEIIAADTGIGIAGEQLQHIFDRFYQVEGLREHAHKGSGIGLALCRELVALHHGEIEAQSEEGKGSRFIVRIPLGDAHLKPGEIAAQAETKIDRKKEREILQLAGLDAGEEEPGRETIAPPVTAAEADKNDQDIILVIDDSADMRSYIRGAVEPQYRVIEASDGEEGIKKALEVIPDIIISDVMMPGMDGCEVCRTLKNDIAASHIPIILLTARAGDENIIQGLESGADDYITKPFSTPILCARIRNLIDIRRQMQQNHRREMTLKPVKTAVSHLDREFFKELHQVIESNLGDPDFNVDLLAKKLYMGRTSLYRKIEALCGENPTDYIRSYRLKRAAQLLQEGAASVTEVAFDVGFSSRTYFTRCFKERFQRLPSEFKETP